MATPSAFGTGTFGGYTTPAFRKSMTGAAQGKDENDPFNFDITKSPLYATTQQSASGFLAGETPGFDMQANIARDAQKASQAQAAKAQREQLIGFGLRDSGQYIDQGIVAPAEQQQRERADLERKLATDREQMIQQKQAQGQQTALGLLGMQSQESQSKAQLGTQKELGYANIGSQERMQEKGIASQEKIAGQDVGARLQIAGMQNDTEKWKVDRAEALTKLGWTREDANLQADREQKSTLFYADQALQRELESGRLSMQDKQLIQQAQQFKDELAFKQWATQAGLDDNAANRVWQTSERIAQQAFTAQEASFDRQLTKDIESGRLSFQEKQLAQEASQFTNELEFKKWATQAGIDDNVAGRIWQASENAKDRTSQMQIQQVQLAFQERMGDKQIAASMMDSLMGYLETLPPDQAAAAMNKLAIEAGITHVVKDDNGNPVLGSDGQPIEAEGFEQLRGKNTALAQTVIKDWRPGSNLTSEQINALRTNEKTAIESGLMTTGQYTLETLQIVSWSDSADRWRRTDEAANWVNQNKGKIYKGSNGKYYEIIGMGAQKERNGTDYVILRDVETGVTVKYNSGSGRSAVRALPQTPEGV